MSGVEPASCARRGGWRLLLVLLVTFAAVAPSVGNGFTMDDRTIALGVGDSGQPNPRVHELQPLRVYFETHYQADKAESGTLYRPLTSLSFALRHRFFGDAPLPAHVANVLLHLLATWLSYLMIGRLASRAAARLGAVVFGVHAIHSEVVAGVVGRDELMAFCCGAAALLLFVRGRRPALELPLAGVLLFAAFCSKESALAWAPFVFVWALAERWKGVPSGAAPAALWPLAGRVLLVAGPGLIAFLWLRQSMIAGLPGPPDPIPYASNPLAHAPLISRLMTATALLGHALRLCVLPYGLSCDYGPQVLAVYESPGFPVLAPAAVVAMLAGVGLARRRRHPLLLVAVAAFFGFAFLTSNLPFPIGTIFGERLYYTPSLGIALAVAWLVDRAAGRLRAAVVAGLLLWIAGSAALCGYRCALWTDNATLFLHDLDAHPRSLRLLSFAAMHARRAGDHELAERHLREAVRLDPEDAQAQGELGAHYLGTGDLARAEEALARAMRASHADPRFEFVLDGHMANLRLRQGDPLRAVPHLVAALHANPDYFDCFKQLWLMCKDDLLVREQLLEALEHGRKRTPHKAHWDVYRGLVAYEERRWSDAAAILEAALPRLGTHPRVVQIRSEARLALGRSLLETGERQQGRRRLQALAGDRFALRATRAAARLLLME